MGSRVVEVPTADISPNPHQPRTVFDGRKMRELAVSIEEHGVIQPLVVAGNGDEGYVLIAGERRWRAAQVAGLATVPVIVREITPQAMLELALVENLQREDLSPLEEAAALQQMRDGGLTSKQIAARVGKSASWVRNELRLLRLPEELQRLVQEGEVTVRQALAVAPAYTMPEEVLVRAQANWAWRYVEQALEAGADSDTLREKARELVEHVSRDLGAAVFPLDEPIEGEGVRCPTCDACDLRLVRNTRCGDPDGCFAVKRRLWIEGVVAEAAEALGLPWATLEEKRRCGHRRSDWRWFREHDRAALEHALAEGCEHLHLAPVTTEWDRKCLGPEGYPQVYYVCRRHGRQCNCSKAAEASAGGQAEQEDGRARKRELLQVREEVVGVVTAALAEGNAGAWRAVLVNLSQWNDRERALGTTDGRAILEKIARILVGSSSYWSDPELARQGFDEWLVKMGIVGAAGEEPADPLAGLRRRWLRIRSWMQNLTQEPPTPEAVHGNVANLTTLQGDLRPLAGDGKAEADALCTDVAGALERLSSLGPVVEEWAGEEFGGFEHVPWLVTVPAGDANFRGHLEEAPVEALRYVLALTRGVEGNRTRVKALERALGQRETEMADVTP